MSMGPNRTAWACAHIDSVCRTCEIAKMVGDREDGGGADDYNCDRGSPKGAWGEPLGKWDMGEDAQATHRG